MKPEKSNILLAPFIILTGSIVVLCVLVQTLLQTSLNDMKSDAAIINIARGQLILSHRLINSVAADNLAGRETNPSLETLQEAFKKSHNLMLSAEQGRDDKAIFNGYLKGVDSSYSRILQAIDINTDSDANNNDFIVLLDRQAAYVKQLDAYITAVTGNSDNKVEKFRWQEIILTACSILIIVLEVIFFFLPALRKIKRQSRQFKAIAFYQSHIIRQPLANIKGLIDLIDMSKLDTETTEIFTYLQQEADKLDDVIKETITTTREK